jgi:hypothetical protein
MKPLLISTLILGSQLHAADAPAQAEKPVARPNIIFLLTDDQRDNTLGAMGHPLNKQEVGRRLGLVAQARTYSAAVEFSGPVFRELKITGNRAVLHFDHLGGGLVSRDTEHAGALRSFAVAGQDRAWHWADAVIDGTTVVVSCADVPEPVAVRYGWATNIACDFYNQAGLPAVPFRTDDWPLTTGDQIYHPGGNFLKAWQSEVTQQRANTPAPNPQAPQP